MAVQAQKPAKVHKFSEYSSYERPTMNRLQASFYRRVFKPAFLEGTPADVQDQHGYIMVMLYELLDQWELDPEATEAGILLLIDAYPGSYTEACARACLCDIRLLQERWHEAVELASSSRRQSMILGLADELGHPRLSPSDVFTWNSRSITQAGYQHLPALLKYLNADLDSFHDARGISMVEDFWNRLTEDAPTPEIVASVRASVGPHLDDVDIASSIEKAREYGTHIRPTAFANYEGHARPIPVDRPWPRPEIFGRVWTDFLHALVRRAENQARVAAGIPKVGEHQLSEVHLLRELQAAFPKETIHHQSRSTWLAPQSLDIVFAQRNIAIEYQGTQHSRPVGYFGGAEAYEDQQSRDALKRWLCEKNGMRLIEVFPNYDLTEVVARIRELLQAP